MERHQKEGNDDEEGNLCPRSEKRGGIGFNLILSKYVLNESSFLVLTLFASHVNVVKFTTCKSWDTFIILFFFILFPFSFSFLLATEEFLAKK